MLHGVHKEYLPARCFSGIGMTARLGPPGQEPRRKRKFGRSEGKKKEAGREHVQCGLITLHDERNRGEREEGNTERNKQVGEDEREKEPRSSADEQDSTDPNTH